MLVGTDQIREDVSQHIEEFACAFAKRTNLPADRIVMCHMLVWDGARLVNKYWFEEKLVDSMQFLPIV